MLFKTAVLLAALVVATAAAAAAAKGDKEARQSITAANNAFAFDLYEVLRREPGNMVVSPLSAATVLALAMTGARGNTRAQMQSALHLPADDARVAAGYRQLLDSLQSTDKITLHVVNKIFAEKTLSVKPSFQQVARDTFRSSAEQVDFGGHLEESRVAINSWVEQVTQSKIKDLIANLDSTTVMVLVNAIYFHGPWLRPFNVSETRRQPFHLSADAREEIPMMHRSAPFRYAELPQLNARALELPYVGKRIRMVILLPDAVDGLTALESNLRKLDLSQLDERMIPHVVDVSLPKFTIVSTYHLHKKLPELGIEDLFSESAANLTGIADGPLHVSHIIQKAFMEVRENGTVAAGATEIEIVDRIGESRPTLSASFVVDHPFVSLLLDDKKNVLFIGRVTKPGSLQ